MLLDWGDCHGDLLWVGRGGSVWMLKLWMDDVTAGEVIGVVQRRLAGTDREERAGTPVANACVRIPRETASEFRLADLLPEHPHVVERVCHLALKADNFAALEVAGRVLGDGLDEARSEF